MDAGAQKMVNITYVARHLRFGLGRGRTVGVNSPARGTLIRAERRVRAGDTPTMRGIGRMQRSTEREADRDLVAVSADCRYGELIASAAQIDASSASYSIRQSGTDMIVFTPSGEVVAYNPGDL